MAENPDLSVGIPALLVQYWSLRWGGVGDGFWMVLHRQIKPDDLEGEQWRVFSGKDFSLILIFALIFLLLKFINMTPIRQCWMSLTNQYVREVFMNYDANTQSI